MLVAIHAYEGIYQGLHGIEDYLVAEILNKEEAYEMGEEMSYDVMNSYSAIYDYFVREAENEGLEENTDEWNEFINQCFDDNVAYNIYMVKETTKSLDELNNMIFYDPDEFIATYCEEF